ncbi:uncharacterized protein LY89DRAFT_690777 [Mollisia scopiformis]|uniref:Uncharacterized protein n=1 Tax=Mollisia scopiformis TaxID=149040 RepID=A0A132B8P3_MOLSC|nr:uncharacterized protein LY89DRAFT_690777 [Mollisia scopiformis]KUJ08766.1 hypothetical protein LY89DRAFT_690777 [Mollisia scopiformis]
MTFPDSPSKVTSSAITPALPDNVCIFSPADPNAASALLNGRIFTRLTASIQTEPSKLSAALRNLLRPEACAVFCLIHRNAILIFDSNGDGEDLQNLHHEHFRLVCLALKDADIGLDVSGCILDAPNVLQAGFQLDKMNHGSVLMIDLMDEENDDDPDSDD